MTARFDGYSAFEIGSRKFGTAIVESQSAQVICEFASVRLEIFPDKISQNRKLGLKNVRPSFL